MSVHQPSLDALRIDRSAIRRSDSSKGKWWLIVAVFIVSAGIVWWLNGRNTSTEVRVTTIRSQTTTASNTRTLLNGSGYITARRAATVSSKVTGKVTEVLVEEGKIVEPGQILARLDATNIEASLHLAEAHLDAARLGTAEIQANLTFAEKELARYAGLIKTNAASQSDWHRAEAEAAAVTARFHKHLADITVAEREVAQWQQQIDDTIIRAPFGGVVTSKNAQPGEMISPMSVGGFTRTGICTIVDMTSLEIEVDVNESFINRVHTDQPVQATLDSYPDVTFPAKVIAIIPTADRQKATVRVRVGFEKLDPRILPDMAVKVAFQSPSDTATPVDTSARSLIVPQSSVHEDTGRHIVWIVQGNKVERRAVTIGNSTSDFISLSAGVNSGETVVITSSAPLHDGQTITIKP